MSDDLVTGTDTGGWGAPAGIFNYCTGQMEYGGMIWYGDEPPTKEDVERLWNHYDMKVKIDVPTMFGLPSHRERVRDLECYQAPVVEL
jgi:hypothetical protein